MADLSQEISATTLSYVFGSRHLRVLGIQGDVQYAQDQRSMLWYRFLTDDPSKQDSWKLVAR